MDTVEQHLIVARQDKYAAEAKYDAAAAKYEANVDEKKDKKLKELTDQAYANLKSANANLQSANEQLTLTLQEIPEAGIGSSRTREVEADPERVAKRSSEMTILVKELQAMMLALRPSGGVKVKQVHVELPQAAENPGDDDEVVTPGTFTLAYLELPEGTRFRTTKSAFGQRLLVRPCYPVLFDHWWERVRITESCQNMPGDILIGTPGIGKSMFLLYAIYRLAQMERGGAIVFQDTAGEMTLFEGNNVSLDQGSAKTALQNPGTVYLCDGSKKGDLKGCMGPFFLASSPNVGVWKRVAEKELCHGPLVVPVCTLGEMLAFRELCFPKVTLKIALEAYEMGGGVPRILKRTAADESYDVKEAIKLSIGSIDIEACKTAIEFGQSKDSNEAHALFHLYPCKGKPLSMTKRTVMFGTTFIEHFVVEHMLKEGRKKVVSFLASSDVLPAFPTLRGVLYEGYAIRRLQEGGDFRCCKLLNRDPNLPDQRTRGEDIVMNVPRSTETIFRRLAELDRFVEERHYRPEHNTLETVDSFVSREWLFQTTIANEHDVKITGLNKVLKHLSDIGDTTETPRLFFVVPMDAYEGGYTCAQPLKSKAGTEASQAGEAGKVEQYVLCVPL